MRPRTSAHRRRRQFEHCATAHHNTSERVCARPRPAQFRRAEKISLRVGNQNARIVAIIAALKAVDQGLGTRVGADAARQKRGYAQPQPAVE